MNKRIRTFSENISTGSMSSFAIPPTPSMIGERKSKKTRKSVKESRKAVVKDLLRQKLSPKQIKHILLTDHVLVKGKVLKSDWTAEEIKGYLIELGIPGKDLWSENPRVPQGDNYHPSVGWY